MKLPEQGAETRPPRLRSDWILTMNLPHAPGPPIARPPANPLCRRRQTTVSLANPRDLLAAASPPRQHCSPRSLPLSLDQPGVDAVRLISWAQAASISAAANSGRAARFNRRASRLHPHDSWLDAARFPSSVGDNSSNWDGMRTSNRVLSLLPNRTWNSRRLFPVQERDR